MIHYHGSPLTPDAAAAQVFAGRHAMVSFAAPEQLPLIAEVCQSFALDNGAFSAWRKGSPIEEWEHYFAWIAGWTKHPGFDWFLIPDVIDGTEVENDALVESCRTFEGAVPVWHLHESLNRLESLADRFRRVALGSSGEFSQIKTQRWWRRMAEAMDILCCGDGRPRCKIHGLRMLDPEVFTRFPFASADSTNVARNVGMDTRWRGTYAPTSKAARGVVLADRIEAHQSAPAWCCGDMQGELDLRLTSEVWA
jgi:hypothetical protein